MDPAVGNPATDCGVYDELPVFTTFGRTLVNHHIPELVQVLSILVPLISGPDIDSTGHTLETTFFYSDIGQADDVGGFPCLDPDTHIENVIRSGAAVRGDVCRIPTCAVVVERIVEIAVLDPHVFLAMHPLVKIDENSPSESGKFYTLDLIAGDVLQPDTYLINVLTSGLTPVDHRFRPLTERADIDGVLSSPLPLRPELFVPGISTFQKDVVAGRISLL